MDDLEIRQQMVARERFAPDAEQVRAAALAGHSASGALRGERHRARLLAGAAAAVVVLIVAAIGIVQSHRAAPGVSLPRPVRTTSGASGTAAPAWVGVDWSLVQVAQGTTHESVEDAGGLVLRFAADGSLTGSAICYGVAGHWTTSGQALRFGPLEFRDHSCPADPRRDAIVLVKKGLESLAAAGATGGHIEGPTLTLESGAYRLTYRNAGRTVVPPASSDAPIPSARPLTSATTTSPSQVQSPTTATAIEGAAVRQRIAGASVYDPFGGGVKDNADEVKSAFDGDLSTFWDTFIYKQQFPSALKPGVGLALEFAKALTPTSVTVSSDTPGTVIEIRSATAPDLPYEQTAALARGTVRTGTTVRPGTVTIPLAGAPRSKYLVVFVVHLGAEGSNFQSDVNEISVLGH